MKVRTKDLPPYLLGGIASEVRALRGAGTSIIDLSQLNPDLPPPGDSLEVLVQSSLRPENHRYSASRGIRRLRVAAADLYKRKFEVELNPSTEVVSTMGTKEGLASTLLSLLEHGDSVLIPSPRYPVHAASVFLAGGQIVEVPLFQKWPESNNLELDINSFLESLEKAISRTWPRPRVLIISFPNNPTSCTLSLRDLEKLVQFASDNSLLIIHDFAYLGVELEESSAPSILQIEGAKELAVELFSLSKGYSLPGWRLGFCLGNSEIIRALARVKSYTDFGIFQAVQIAAASLIESGDQVLEDHAGIYRSRSEVLVRGLRKAGWQAYQPKAALFVWAKPPLSEEGESTNLARKVLEQAQVAVSPGCGFGESGAGWLRFALVAKEEQLQTAVKQIAQIIW